MEIKLKDVSYEDKIKNLNYTFPSNTVTGMIGKSHSGKTLITYLLLGLVYPMAGNIKIATEKVTAKNIKKIRQKIGYTFQNPTEEFFCRTVREELMINQSTTDSKLIEFLQVVGLSQEYLNKDPLTLSLGEQAKLTIALALIKNPSLYIFDDPTTYLDQSGINTLIKIIRKLKKEGKTIIIISNNITFLSSISDHIILLDQGTIQQSIPTKNIIEYIDTIKEYNIEIPRIYEFINLVKKETGIKLRNTYEVKELMKDIYRHVT